MLLGKFDMGCLLRIPVPGSGFFPILDSGRIKKDRIRIRNTDIIRNKPDLVAVVTSMGSSLPLKICAGCPGNYKKHQNFY
jgi:hypothetical protein